MCLFVWICLNRKSESIMFYNHLLYNLMLFSEHLKLKRKKTRSNIWNGLEGHSAMVYSYLLYFSKILRIFHEGFPCSTISCRKQMSSVPVPLLLVFWLWFTYPGEMMARSCALKQNGHITKPLFVFWWFFDVDCSIADIAIWHGLEAVLGLLA